MDAESQRREVEYVVKQGGRMTDTEYALSLSRANTRAAADEYMAHLSENGFERGVWEKVKQAIIEALRKIGFDIEFNDSDIKKLLEQSYGNLTGNNTETTDNDESVRFSIANIEKGMKALESIANGEDVVYNAMRRDDLVQYGGNNEITFYYGNIGDPARNFKGGYGISHIGAKHGVDAIINAVRVIADGKVERYVKGNKTVVLTDGEYETILALTRFGNKETWLFNGWKKKENAGDNGEVSTTSASTQTNPTFSREDLGAAISNAKVQQKYEPTSENRKNISNKPLYSAYNADDENYMKAVESGDMETAQRMVVEAANKSMPDTKIVDENGEPIVVYHGTTEDFSVFDKTKGRPNMDIQGMFFSPSKEEAEGYGSNVGSFFLNIKNPADFATGFATLQEFKGQNNAGVKAREYLIEQGYDGVNNDGEEYIAFNPNQIKSADPVTYDEQGNVIPLSKRFDVSNEDIRFSVKKDNNTG